MIAYETLVQTLADWKSGVRPTAPTPPPAVVHASAAVPGEPEQYDELDSGVVDVGEDEQPQYETEDADAEPESEWSEEG